MNLPAFMPATTWQLPKELPSWKHAKRIAVDLETRDPQLTSLGPGVRRDGRVVGVAFSIEDGPSAYLPIGHEMGQNLDPEVVWRYLRDQAKGTKATIVTANGQYDHDYLLQNGVDLLHCPWFDVQIADPLIDELQERYDLDSILRRYGLPGKDERLLQQFAAAWGVHPKRGLWQLPPEAVGAYAEGDVRPLLALARRQERRMAEEGLERVFHLESRLQPVLLKMRRRGVRVDFDRVAQTEAWALEEETLAYAELYRRLGFKLSPEDTNKTAAWVPVLQRIGVAVPKTEKGNDSVTKELLDSLKHPVADLIRRIKKLNKLRTTFCASARRHAVAGRIHCTFNQLRRESDEGEDSEGARYGRLSCVDPNLQQQPSPERDPEIGKRLRGIFVPDEGGEWACLDFSQQEPRWLVHYAELLGSTRAKEAADKYRNDPKTDNHDMMATLIDPNWPSIADKDLKKKQRSDAKIIFLGLCYGMGEAKLCRSLGLPTKKMLKAAGKLFEIDSKEALAVVMSGVDTWQLDVAGEEGAKLLAKFREGVPFVHEFAQAAQRRAERMGYVVTAGGRRCRFPRRDSRRGWDFCHKAGNRIIQGSSGDQAKKAMVDADAAGIRLQLQVHDELDLTRWSKEETDLLTEIMLNALPCNVPHKVDCEVGPDWGHLEKDK